MDEKNKVKQISIAVAICIITLAALGAASVGIYKYFYNNNKEVIETNAENNFEEKNVEEETIELIDPETLEDEELLDEETQEETEKNEETEKELSAEEKKQREEEEKKKQEEAKKKKQEEEKKRAQAYPYWIKVNYSANTVTIYKKDDNGNYTIPVKAMVCSTGASTPRSGVYRTPQKARWGSLIGSYGQYCTRVTGQILFHSVPYLKNGDKTSLEYWEYDRLGETRSLGCIRLTVIDAKWLFDNCPLGTSVEFYSSSNPGPLGKPSAKKISGYASPLKNWDPTDPDPNNPWHNQNAKEKAEEEARKQEEERVAKEKAAKEEAERRAAEERAAREKAEREKAEREEAARKEAEEKAKKEEEEKNNVVVPNVVGLTEVEAKKQLKAKGFTVIVKAENSDKNIGKIIKQSLPAQSKYPKGTAITIVLSKEKENTENIKENNTNDDGKVKDEKDTKTTESSSEEIKNENNKSN